MSALIVVLKKDLAETVELNAHLSQLSSEVIDLTDSFAYRPNQGKLLQLISTLEQNRITYEIKSSK